MKTTGFMVNLSVRAGFILVLSLSLLLGSDSCISADRAGFAVNRQYGLEIPGLKPGMLESGYWIAKLENPDGVILDSLGIEVFNNRNFTHCEKLVDLRHLRLAFSGARVRELVSMVSARPESKCFSGGKALEQSFFDDIFSNLHTEGIPEVVRVRFGVTVRRSEMRILPTPVRVFDEEGDYEFDRLIATVLYPLEPIAILHTSRDGQWLFAQCYNYTGWISSGDVAIGTRREIFRVLDRSDFLVVTGKRVFTGFDPIDPSVSEMQLDMGTRVPLALGEEVPEQLNGRHPMGNFVVSLPARDEGGRLVWKLGLVSLSDDVSVGYLPYTRRNIITQAFKFLGQRYGWGGMFNARDCSSFVLDVFRTMGLLLPRDAEDQGELSYGKFHGFAPGTGLGERAAVFGGIPPATPVYMKGHAMLYLDRDGGDFFIIHDFTNLRTMREGKLNTLKARSVFVTPLMNTYLSDGTTYLQGLYGAREFR